MPRDLPGADLHRWYCPLRWAAYSGNAALTKRLIDAGANAYWSGAVRSSPANARSGKSTLMLRSC
jgi:hypothetical protein